MQIHALSDEQVQWHMKQRGCELEYSEVWLRDRGAGQHGALLHL